MKKKRRIPTLFINRFIWATLFLGICIGAFFSGERILYLTAVVLFVLPFLSLIITFALLRGLRVFRSQPETIMKNAEGILSVDIHNKTPMPLGSLEVLINADENAISVLENQNVQINPFGRRRLEIPFVIEFRGHYNFGLAAVQVSDITGLFRLKREFDAAKMITALPQVADVSNFPLSMNLMTQASSRHDMRDEDYSTISDIRQYLPTDSIKRVHWKLTAKRNEWLVKNFQSNALNLVSIILDISRVELQPRQTYALEDGMIENALGVAKFCLNKQMPVDFITSDGQRINARKPADFGIIYETTSELHFLENAEPNCHGVLSQTLTEATGYVNAVVITPNLTAELYERVVKGTKSGHHITILYFEISDINENSEEIFKLLSESGIQCFKLQ
ncbi:MAG: DUF58 domain-containing protein [Defluviitaleaceae bacterium]|nr:DUF58 domain-containing protein [Defluviitaleaceae bacterium]